MMNMMNAQNLSKRFRRGWPAFALAGSLFLFARPSVAQLTGINYEKMLLPVYVSEPLSGAFGSLWNTDLWVRNNSEHPVHMYLYRTGNFIPGPTPHVPASLTLQLKAASASLGERLQGSFLYVDERFADEVTLHLRVRDLSRQSQTWGTEVPVVREREFRTKPIVLPDVPTGSGFRQVLRIYNLDGQTAGGEVTVRLYAFDPGLTSLDDFGSAPPDRLLGQRTANFRITEIASSSSYPGYVEISDLSEIAPIAGVERVSVEIAPVTSGLKFWAFVSVVDNDTQHLTVITPQ